ncbi:MAG: DUF1934 domain-containing protein [Schwartzia sp.]|nr:DUF1934 domain-containing protein [Schwartzia sp. (in: firmicutes)]
MDRVIVRVRGEQTCADGETNRIEVVAEGRHFYKNGLHYVLYDDHMADEKISTTLKIAPDSVLLLRRGAVSQEQRFVEGTESTSEYRTPFGSLELSVATSRMEVACGDVSGEIHVDYAMFVGGTWQSDNALHIEICPVPGEIGRLN